MILLLLACMPSTSDPEDPYAVDTAAGDTATGGEAHPALEPAGCYRVGVHGFPTLITVPVTDPFVWTGTGCGELWDVDCALDVVSFIVATDAMVVDHSEPVSVSIVSWSVPAGGGTSCTMTWIDGHNRAEQLTTILIPVTG